MDVDAITIATPDHWHAPMAILGLQAGKHVYVEKPCSHNPGEGALLVRAQQKYGKLVQMGTQQRSSPHTIEIVEKIHNGLVGRAYFAKAWYNNTRKSIGVGKDAAVPATLDWDLWQGPAPRRAYKDNVQPYNWHWFRVWGTGETLNNGTHEVDVCRWALGVDLPNRVTASGGRYAYKDDWQFYDTLTTSFEYDDKMVAWENTCCNGMAYFNRGRGSLIEGTTGTVLVDRDGYEIYDLKGKKVDEFLRGEDGQDDYSGPGGRRFDDRCALREFHCGRQNGREVECAGCGGERRGHDAAALEHCVGGEARARSRSGGWKDQGRRRGDEVLGSGV